MLIEKCSKTIYILQVNLESATTETSVGHGVFTKVCPETLTATATRTTIIVDEYFIVIIQLNTSNVPN